MLRGQPPPPAIRSVGRSEESRVQPLPPAMHVKVPASVGPFAEHHLVAATTGDVGAETADPVRSGVAA